MKRNINIKITKNENVIISDSNGTKIKMSIIDLCGIAREYEAFCYREDLKDLVEKAVVRGDVPMNLISNKRFHRLLLSEYMDAKEEEDNKNSERCFQEALSGCLPFEEFELEKTATANPSQTVLVFLKGGEES